MKFVSLSKNKLVNIAAIAQAQYEESVGGVKLQVLLVSGAGITYLAKDARTLWAVLQKTASEQPSAT
jgi:hypothetical protein